MGVARVSEGADFTVNFKKGNSETCPTFGQSILAKSGHPFAAGNAMIFALNKGGGRPLEIFQPT
jgi:hypothetical protein